MRDIVIGCFFAFVFIREAMSSKFLLGFLSGAYVATQYNFKPYFDLAEEKVRQQLEEFKKEAETKPVEPKQTVPIENPVKAFFTSSVSNAKKD